MSHEGFSSPRRGGLKLADSAERETTEEIRVGAQVWSQSVEPLTPDALVRHIDALRSWGHRIGLAARGALAAAGEIETGVGPRTTLIQAISTHFGLEGGSHSLHVEPLGWLRISETQATKGLEHFLARDPMRIRLFLQALAPTVAWPADFGTLSVTAEAPAGRGRIDLLVEGRAQGRVWGAVVEAKFEHSLKGNPLSAYKRQGSRLGMAFVPGSAAAPSGTLVVLGKTLSRQTKRKISRNAHWRFVHWREVLRRFDAELDEPTVDEDFRRFRRTLWERAGSAT